MKKSCFLFFVLLLFIACGDKENDDLQVDNANLLLSHENCTLTNDSPYVIVDIKKGAGGYIVSSSDELVARAYIEDNKLYICAIGDGNATITVKDMDNNIATVKVDIYEIMLTPTPLSEIVFVKKGTTRELNYPVTQKVYDYIVSEDGDISTATIKENKIYISGNNIGETDIYLAEMIWIRHVFAVRVVDVYDLIINGKEIFMQVGAKDKGFNIVCGNGDYEITSTDDSVVSYEVIPYVRDLNGVTINPVTILVNGLKTGTAQLTVTDKEGKTDIVDVTVR